MNPGFTLQEVGISAAKTLSAIHQESFPTGWNISEFSDLLTVAGTRAWLAENDAGMIICRTLFDQSEILTLAVRPAFRRQKIAQALLAAAMEAAQASGAAKMFLEVAENNEAAQAFYEHFGFKITGRRKDYYRQADGKYVDALVMTKEFA